MEFDERITASGIISALKDTSYTAIDDYVSDMDFDYMEEYVGEGLFGSPKYKNKWCFTRFDIAAKSYIDDLSWAIGYMSYDIEDGAIRLINSAFKTFEEKIKQEFSDKIDELKNIFNLNFRN